jgi:hypothetical protein
MSEFKFACPVCGQHITVDSSISGSQLNCPTCFRKLMVPPPPVSTDSKWIVTTSEAESSEPASVKSHPRPSSPMLGLRIALAIVLVILLIALAARFIF